MTLGFGFGFGLFIFHHEFFDGELDALKRSNYKQSLHSFGRIECRFFSLLHSVLFILLMLLGH